jgi:predicted secreted Zn-dependent protease
LPSTPSKEGTYYYAGVTIWDLNSSYDLVDTAKGCAVKNSEVRLNTTIHLPQLAETRLVSASVRAEWTRFSNALKTHEMLHAKNAYRAAMTLRARSVVWIRRYLAFVRERSSRKAQMP